MWYEYSTTKRTVPYNIYFYDNKGESLERPEFGNERAFYTFLDSVFCVQICHGLDYDYNRLAIQDILQRPLPKAVHRITGNDAKMIAANIMAREED